MPTQDNDSMNKHGVYIRFGDWPENERSQNYALGGHEHGVSVYDMAGSRHYAEPTDPDPEGMSESGDSMGDMITRRRRSIRSASFDGTQSHWEHHDDQDSGNRGHFVKGTVVGVGHDGEPLLQNVQHVGAWPQDAHHFAAGVQPPLWTQ